VTGDIDIAAVGAALGDTSRAAMLLALLGGDELTAGELARIAGKSPSAASAHLRTLCDAGLVIAATSGRHRLFRRPADREGERSRCARAHVDLLSHGRVAWRKLGLLLFFLTSGTTGRVLRNDGGVQSR
jgi:DNA-binding transcriptional ArsR family regulator